MNAFLRRCRKYFVFAGFFSIFINALQLTFPLYMLSVYVNVLPGSHFSTLYAMTAMALVALFTMGCLELLRSRLLVRAGVKLDNLLSKRVLKDMLRDLCRPDSMHYTQGLKDINTLRGYLGGTAIFAFFDAPWIVIYLWVIFLVHPVLGMTATMGAVVILIIGVLQAVLSKKSSAEAERLAVRKRQWVDTSLRSARELQCMGMIGDGAARLGAISEEQTIAQDQTGKVGHILGSIGRSFQVLMQVIIFGAGALLVLANDVNPGVIIAASIIMGRALAPVNQAIEAWKQTAGAKLAYTNLKHLLATAGQSRALQLSGVSGGLNITDVSLTRGRSQVLKGIDFQLQPGEIMGLIGPNGAGKTTLCRIILGMWAPDTGNVTLDGHNVIELDNDAIGRHLGYLPQDVELFAGTVKENIARMGAIDADEIVAAAKRAGAHEAIVHFPQGYDTDIGEAGLSLSGGQRQRVGLARALYGAPGLVILDEPNSNLDEQGEKALMQALQQLKAMNTTTIMITHKAELLQAVDTILKLENGEQRLFGSRDDVSALLQQ